MKKQFIDYAVYKADHSGISAANNFYTHRAEITKQKNRYLLTLKVKVKHGLVKFQPLQMSLGKIVKRNFQRIENKDCWTYITAFKSLKQLDHQISGSLRLSVPIAGINHQIFKVWFAFGVKDVAKNDVVQKSLADSNQDNNVATTNNSSNESSVVSKPENQNKRQIQRTNSVPKKKANDAALKQLKKYQVSPKKMVFAETALAEYPILQTVLAFLLIDLLIVAGVLGYWRWNLRKQGKQK